MLGILLINLGTPDAPTETAVREYLDVFLSDPYVITLPKLLRDFLVQKIILPKRPTLSAHAYQQVWTDAGSPLLVNTLNLRDALQKKLEGSYCVAVGMRYGNPSIQDAVELLQPCKKIIVFPLFPQFAKATSQSSIDCAMNALQEKKYNLNDVHIIEDFYQEDFYIHSVSSIIQQSLQQNPTDFLLMSYHGLPKRQIDPNNNYQQKCYVTSQRIAETLNLSSEKYQVSFQSRLGLAKWIEPYTDRVLTELRKKNIKTVSVVCPSFVADCVETLEEINIRLRAQWMKLGGDAFHFIPCLNADEKWVERLILFFTCSTVIDSMQKQSCFPRHCGD